MFFSRHIYGEGRGKVGVRQGGTRDHLYANPIRTLLSSRLGVRMEEGISPVPPCLTPTLPPDTLRLNTSKPPGHPFIHTKKTGPDSTSPVFLLLRLMCCLECECHTQLQLMEVLIHWIVHITQVSILIFSHQLNVLVERIIQSQGHSVHRTSVNTGRIRIICN